MQTLIIKVYAENVDPMSRARLFERQISISSSVTVDYAGLEKAMRFLFGTRIVVIFELHP